jgi:succinate dehydrogenase/fumarate reductase flavoprotein subunit
MWENVGIFRNGKNLQIADDKVQNFLHLFENKYKLATKEEYELKNMLTTANLIIKSALKRKESRGSHYRTDYPEIGNISEHSLIIQNKGEINFVK